MERYPKPKIDNKRIKDNRPLTRKEYQIGCCRNVIEFVVINTADFPISLPVLLIPDMKLF